jgi:serine O-acetyltransferase
MEQPFRRTRMILNSVRLIPHLILMLFADSGGLLKADMARWAVNTRSNKPNGLYDYVLLFISFMTFIPEFRNLFYYRFGVKAKLFNWLCPRLGTLYIDADYIGPGFFIQHGVSTQVSAESIGENCWINQHVTVGYTNETDRPTIGNNVKISPGATILGKVTLGDNSTVAPNTVVLDNVPPGATVIGVPGRIVWLGGTNEAGAREHRLRQTKSAQNTSASG